MRRLRALSAAFASYCIFALFIVNFVFSSDDVNPCKRQPFRGRCPTTINGQQIRSQFVLRFYIRNGECVSYPYGHCSNDENEPKLFRYKEECEDACLENIESTTLPFTTIATKDRNDVGFLDVGNEEIEEIENNHIETYGTNKPVQETTLTYETEKTECQKQRAVGNSRLVKGGFVPECTPNGDFEQLQCESDKQTCFCVTTEGIEIPNSRCKPEEPKPDCSKISSAKPMRSNECTGGSESGPCKALISRWFYDEMDQVCKQFSYSGCGGNGNNYATEESCQRRCVPEPNSVKCSGGGIPLKGSSGVDLVNCAATTCPSGYKCNVIQDQSICCPDFEKSPNAGILHSGVQPEKPTVNDKCNLSKERGTCDRYELRFYYNSELNECKYFFYGGCEGNENNFKQVEECESACVKAIGQKTTKFVTVTETTQEVVQTTAKETEIVSTASPLLTIADAETEFFSTTVENRQISTKEDTQTSENKLILNTNEPSTSTFTETEVTDAPKTNPTTDEFSEQTETESSPKQSLPQPTLPPQAPPARQTSSFFTATTNVLLPANKCAHKLDPGNCGAEFVRWYWNKTAKTCETFTYTGCGGNGNNFGSREECLGLCYKEDVLISTKILENLDSFDLSNACEVDIDPGECGGKFMRYGFDRQSNECRRFQYGGCGGNANNFASLTECKMKCFKKAPELSLNICTHQIDSGECDGRFNRFAFDEKLKECREFIYGGCGGNGNNFATIEDCRNSCFKAKCTPVPDCDLSRCQLVRDSHNCLFCSCPPPQRVPAIHISPPTQTRNFCPLFDKNTCTEPCIIFSNRRGCQECVCPVLPKLVPPEVLAPLPPSPVEFSEFISLPNLSQTHQSNNLSTVAAAPSTIVKLPAPGKIVEPPTPVKIVEPPAPIRIVEAPALVKIVEPPAPVRIVKPLAPLAPPEINEKITNEVEFKHIVPPASSVSIGDLGDKCSQPLDPGPCHNFVQRWHFNLKSGQCEQFQYGGCAGNRNHFFTRNECVVHCARFLRNQEMMVEKLTPDQLVISQSTQQSTLQPKVVEKIVTQPLQQQIIHKINRSSIVVTEQKSVFVPQPPKSVQPKPNVFVPRQHVVEPFHPLLTSVQPFPESTLSTIDPISTSQSPKLVQPKLNVFEPRQHVVEPFHPLLTSVQSLPESTLSTIDPISTSQSPKLVQPKLNVFEPRQHVVEPLHPLLTSVQSLPESTLSTIDPISTSRPSQPVQPKLNVFEQRQHVVEPFHPLLTSVQSLPESTLSTIDPISTSQSPKLVQPKLNVFEPRQHVVEPFHPLLTSVQPLPESTLSTIDPISTPRPSQPIQPQPNLFVPRQHVVEPFHPLFTSVQPLSESKLPIIDPISIPQPINKIDMNVELKSQIRGPDSFKKSNINELKILKTGHKLPILKIKTFENFVKISTTTKIQPIDQTTEEQKISTVQLKTTSTAQTTTTPKTTTMTTKTSTTERQETLTTNIPLSSVKINHEPRPPSMAAFNNPSPPAFKPLDEIQITIPSKELKLLPPPFQSKPETQPNKLLLNEKIDIAKAFAQPISLEFAEKPQIPYDMQMKILYPPGATRSSYLFNIEMTTFSTPKLQINFKNLTSPPPIIIEPKNINLTNKNKVEYSTNIDLKKTQISNEKKAYASTQLKQINIEKLQNNSAITNVELISLNIPKTNSTKAPATYATKKVIIDTIENQQNTIPLEILTKSSNVTQKIISLPSDIINQINDNAQTITNTTVVESNLTTQEQIINQKTIKTATATPTKITTTTNNTTITTDKVATTIILVNSSTETVPVKTTTQKVILTNQNDLCALPPDAGLCIDYVLRWFFNAQTGKCEQFSFGSCGGNKNNFLERSQCEAQCQPKLNLLESCIQPKVEGFGGQYFPKWYFNHNNLRCEQFVYFGAGGNNNQFESSEECEQTCSLQNSKLSATTTTNHPEFIAPPFSPKPLIQKETEKPRKIEKILKKDSAELKVEAAKIFATSENEVVEPIEEVLTEQNRPNYGAELLSSQKLKPSNLPIIAPSMKARIDYGNNKRLENEPTHNLNPVQQGLPSHIPEKLIDGKNIGDLLSGIDNGKQDPSLASGFDSGLFTHMPICPNGLNAMQYSDGRPVMCLPGKNQCPDKSVCFFNGLDYFCCPNEDDPYDKHVFGGYDGEETKHGYKNEPLQLNIRSIRRLKREALPPISFSLDQISSSLRFDGKAPNRISSAGLANRRVSPCLQDLDQGNCNKEISRYFYDINEDKCRLFNYTGCDGNTNNFLSENECNKRCKIGTILVYSKESVVRQPTFTTTFPSLVAISQCPNGEAPLGDSTPVLCGSNTDSIACPTGYYCKTGPPNICCLSSNDAIDLHKILASQQEVRRKPFINGEDKFNKVNHSGTEEHIGSIFSLSTVASVLSVPWNMCPDGSDGLLKNGQAVLCGTGVDGFSLCPRGYYCSIEPEQNSRLCCALVIQSSNLLERKSISPIAPHFGRRAFNPGEIIDRGSLPSDLKQAKLIIPASNVSKEISEHNLMSRLAEVSPAIMPVNGDSEFASLLLKPNNSKLNKNLKEEGKLSQLDRIFDKTQDNNTPSLNEDPFEAENWGKATSSSKAAVAIKDKSICFLRPNEGRHCHPDEQNLNSNLQFFYSAQDRVCKVFFYRGCAGNANRFISRRECEQYCSSKV